MRIFVTGGTGFVGRAFVAAAIAEGHDVTAGGRQPAARAKFCALDLQNGTGLDTVPWREFDAVVHLAAAGVKASHRKWEECVMVNVVGTARLLSSLRRAAAQPMVCVAQTFYETEVSRFPRLLENPYVATKHAATELARDWQREMGGRLILARLFQAYGAGDDSGNVLNYAVDCFRRGIQAQFGSGTGQRDWIHIGDVARALVACLATSGSDQTTFDLGTGRLTPIRTVIERLAVLAGAPPALMSFDPRRDRDDLGLVVRASSPPPNWMPKFDLDSGLFQLLNPDPKFHSQ